MNGLAVFCLATVFFLAARDLLLPETRDVEVWFGFEFRGALALATAPLQWAIFLVGAWAFWSRQPWILPWAAGYAFYIALSHLVWNEMSPNGQGWTMGALQAAAFSVPGFLLLRAHRLGLGRPASD